MMISAARRLLAAAALAVAATLSSPAAIASTDSQDPGQQAADFVKRFVSQADILLADQAMDPRDRARVFHGLLTSGFDVDVITRFVLDEHWYDASPEQRAAFRELFSEYLYTIYEEHLARFDGMDMQIVAAREKGSNGALVRSRLASRGGAPLDVEWRLWEAKGGWRIVDVQVQGVSLVKAYRQQLASLIGSAGGDVATILNALREIAPAAGAETAEEAGR